MISHRLDQSVGRLGEYRWTIFASTNAVDWVFNRLAAKGLDARAFGGVTIGAIGPATAEALAQRGISADFVPKRSTSEAVLDELKDRAVAGRTGFPARRRHRERRAGQWTGCIGRTG